MNQPNRITITVSREMAEQLDRLKQEQYYATSHSEMLRDLIRIGLEATREKEKMKQEG